MSFVFLTLCCKGRYSTNSVLAHTLLLQPGDHSCCCSKALSVCDLSPPPPEGICLLLMTFLFSQGPVDTVRNVTVSQGFCSFVRPHKVEFPMAADSKRVLCSQPGKKPGKLRIKHLSVV